MKSFWMGLAFASVVAMAFVACSSSPKKELAQQKFQEVEFTEAEVPYIQSVKKDGKLSAVIVDKTNSAPLTK